MHNRFSKSLLASIILALLLSACTLISPSETKPPISNIPSTSVPPQAFTVTPPPYPTRMVDISHLPPTQTKQPTTSVQTVTNKGPIPVCSGRGIPKQPQVDFGLPGTIIYQGEEIFHGMYVGGPGMKTVGGSPLTYSQLPVNQTQRYDVFGFSPNGNWLAFSPVSYDFEGNVIYGNPKIVLLSASGEKVENVLDTSSIQSTIPEGYLLGDFDFGYWINNDLLYGYFNIRVWPEFLLSSYEGRSSVIDTFSGVLIPDVITKLDNTNSNQSMGFSPDMSRVLYQSSDGFTLFDLIYNHTIWSAKVQIPYGVQIDWSPDSSYVAYAVLGDSINRGLVSILSREGEMETILSDSFSGYQVGSIKWSPDSRNLALTLKSEAGEQSAFIYNLQYSQNIYQCPILGENFIGDVFWSPDAEYIAYGYFGKSMVVLNLQTGDVFELGKIGVPVGWSDKFPTVWP